MAGNGTDKKSSDVVVVADYHSYLPPALELAIALADNRRLALRGLFVEDADLAIVCSLPFSQEITLTSARPRTLEQQRTHRSLQNLSRRFQQLLSEGAARASLAYSFDSVPGRRQALELGGEVKAPYLVVGQPGPVRDSRRNVLRVLLVHADMEATLPVLECLQALRRERHLDLLVMDGKASMSDENLRDFLGRHGEVACRYLPVTRLGDVFLRTGQAPELVVASRHCPHAVLETLLKLSACPVILTD